MRLNAMALVGMGTLNAKADERERLLAEIVTESREVSVRFAAGTALVREMRSNVAVAR